MLSLSSVNDIIINDYPQSYHQVPKRALIVRLRIICKDNQCHRRLQISAGESSGDALRGKSGGVLRQIALRVASNRQPFCVKTHPDLRQNAPSFCVKSAPRFASNREKAKT